MPRLALKTLAGVSSLALTLAVSAQIVHAQPDLVIEKKDSQLDFVSCNEGEPLVKGRMVMRNEGDSDANLRQAEDLFRSFIAVYVPENIDLIDKGRKRTKMEPREQRAVDVEVGRGKVKTGRNYNAFGGGSSSTGFPSGNDWLKNKKKYEKEIKQVQQVLVDFGYYLGDSGKNKDGVDGAWGPASKRALSKFQKRRNLKKTDGNWNDETAKEVASQSGGGSTGPSNIKDDQGRTKITVFAVVDPYNLIDESNEANNIVAYTGWLKCD